MAEPYPPEHPVSKQRVSRALHPGAWWVWALGLATAASRTNNLLLLGLIVAVAGFVVAERRTSAPWARAFHASLLLGAVVIVVRLAFEVVFGATVGATVLVGLPELALPDWAAGVSIGGPVSLEALLGAARDGARIAAMIACVGAANALANPSRLLKSVPGALYEVGVAVVVALTLAPQAVEDLQRLRRARRLRGRPDGWATGWVTVARPALEGALERSLRLAASMDGRGYGRSAAVSPRSRRVDAGLVLAGLLGVLAGLYGLMDAGSPGLAGLPLLLVGVVLAATGMRLAGRRNLRTRYRPDPWRLPEWSTTLAGLTAGAVSVLAARAGLDGMLVPVTPLTWPSLPVLPALGILVAVAPAWTTPPQEVAPRAEAEVSQARPHPPPQGTVAA